MSRKVSAPWPLGRLRLAMRDQSGYTLFLVLELLIIIMVFFSVMLHEIQFARVLASREVQRVQARFLAESGVARAEYFLSGNEGQTMLWESDGYIDSFPLYGRTVTACKRFGLFSKLRCRGTRLHTTCAISAIAGRRLPDECTPVLTLHGKVGSLALMPGSKIKGAVVLFRGKVCQGATVREVHDPGLSVGVKESPSLPFDSSQAINVVTGFMQERAAACSSSVLAGAVATLKPGNDTSDSGRIEVINGDCTIEEGSFTNRTVIVVGALILAGDARCQACRFSAQKIMIEGGGSEKCVFFSERRMEIAGGLHNSQFFGCDSILIGNGANYGPMSLWMLMREGARDSTASLFIAPGARFQGTIICWSDTMARKQSRLPEVIFGQQCTFTGVCLADGDIDLSGATVNGNLWVRSIVTSSDNKAYVNYLFNTVIQGEAAPLIFPLVGSGNASVVIDPLSVEYSVHKSSPVNHASSPDSLRNSSDSSKRAQ